MNEPLKNLYNKVLFQKLLSKDHPDLILQLSKKGIELMVDIRK